MKKLLKINWFLLALLVASAITAIVVRQMNRQAFIELSKVEYIGQQYDIEWGQLLIQEAAVSNPLIILNRARGELDMISPNGENSALLSKLRRDAERWQLSAENVDAAPDG